MNESTKKNIEDVRAHLIETLADSDLSPDMLLDYARALSALEEANHFKVMADIATSQYYDSRSPLAGITNPLLRKTAT